MFTIPTGVLFAMHSLESEGYVPDQKNDLAVLWTLVSGQARWSMATNPPLFSSKLTGRLAGAWVVASFREGLALPVRE